MSTPHPVSPETRARVTAIGLAIVTVIGAVGTVLLNAITP